MAHLTLQEVIEATQGTLLAGSAEKMAASLSIDSRTLATGDLFIALRGPRFDGHAFVPEVFRKGACAAVVSEMRPEYVGLNGGSLILVRDTTKALQDIGERARMHWSGRLVAVTGSAGKTTTKEMIARVLEAAGRVLKSQGNLNNHFGVPLTLYSLDSTHSAAVLEMGMNHPGEIRRLCEIAHPNVGVFTNVAPVHLEFFPSVEAIAGAKAELADYLNPQGAIIYNGDDPLVRRIGENFGGDKLSYGMMAGAQVQARTIRSEILGQTRFEVGYGDQSLDISIPMIGDHNVYNALAAMATGLYFRMDAATIARQLSVLTSSSMRGEILQFAGGFTLIDDSYNSNPRALCEMVQTIARLPGFQRRIVAAGSMLELGRQSAELHEECGRFIACMGIDLLIGVGPETKSLLAGAMAGGMAPQQMHWMAEASDASSFICSILHAGDLLLAKGSRATRMDRVVAQVQQTFALRGA